MRLKAFIIWITVLAVPAHLMAQDAATAPATAVLYGDDVSVNNSVIPKSTTLFPGDIVTTNTGIANLVETGSSAIIDKSSIVDYEKSEHRQTGQTQKVDYPQGDHPKKILTLEHGHVQVSTSVGMSVEVRCILVSPAEQVMTKYEVLDVNGKIQIAALQGDVIIHDSAGDAGHDERLNEGKQGTRDDAEKCGPAPLKSSPLGHGVLDSKGAWAGIAGGGGGILVWLLSGSKNPPPPMSNDQP